MAQTINVDISTRGAPPVAYTHQGDTDRTFLVNLFENGEAFAVAGFTVKVAAILPGDGGYTVISGTDMVSATKTTTGTNQIMFTPSAQYTARSGRGILTLIMTTNTGTPATLRPINIDFRIQKSADGEDVIEGASDFPEGLEAIAESVFQEYLSTYLPPVAPSSSADANKAASAKLTGQELDNLKSDLSNYEYVDGCSFIKELYINSAGKTAGVTKLHQIYTEVGGSPSYFLRFSNGTTFTGHTEATSTPDYDVLTIYSGQTGTSDIYGYVIVNWPKIDPHTPVQNINDISYNIDCSPKIASLLGVERETKTLLEKSQYVDYDLINPNFQLRSTDYDMNDVTDTNNRFATTDAFFCKGKVRVEFDESIVGIGLKMYIMSIQSGRNSQWAYSQPLDANTYTLQFDDNIRIAIFNGNGISPQYNTVVNTTKIYTLKESDYFEYLNNKIIGAKNIWCFGDSLTAGVSTGTTTMTESYPYWLKQFLKDDDAVVSNFGVPGDTAVNMLSVISSKTFYENCDIAILMIGTNGYMNGDASDPTTQLGAYYAAIEHIINSGKGTVKIIMVNPPKSIRSGVPTRWLDSMHYKQQAIAQHFNLDLIDMYTYLPFAPDNAVYYSSDQTHFTNVGYYYIAYIIYQYLATHMTAQQIGGSPVFDY